MLSRRGFLNRSTAAAAGLVLPWGLRIGKARADEPDLLDAGSHPKFVNPLPLPTRLDATGGGRFTVTMKETSQWLGLVDHWGDPLMTPVWGYRLAGDQVTYPGPTFVAYRDAPVAVKWVNKLPSFRSAPYDHLVPVDATVHWADPEKGGIPTVTHLHGGHTESASDGLPEAWFTQKGERGPTWAKSTYRYDNDQEAATLWYHDHALGITRLNVYAGLAGFYLLRDDNEAWLTGYGILPSGAQEIELVVQDRMFSEDGQLFLPSEPDPAEFPWAPSPSIVAEFFGDFILVNGAAWPVLEVEPRKYRFRLLNGSDSRFYVLEFRDDRYDGTALPFLQIGTDGGLLNTPVPLTRLVIGPGERADVIVDFDALGASPIFLRNFGPDDPFKGLDNRGNAIGGPANPGSSGQVMRFDVTLPVSGPDAWVDPGTDLRPLHGPIPDLGPVVRTRRLLLFEGEDSFGRLMPLLGVAEPTVNVEGDTVDGTLVWDETRDPVTENPDLHDVEIWEVFNATEDAHPIHLHLVTFQILERQRFSADIWPKYQVGHDGSPVLGGRLSDVKPKGRSNPPEPNEAGWKDTAQMFPGEVTRVIAKFDRPGRYVWHCHILSHEDHEMMRPYFVGPYGP